MTVRANSARRVLPGVLAGVVVVLTGALPAGAAATTTMVTGERRVCTVVGTSGNDRLYGTGRYDVICGRGGNDVIFGGGGGDVIDGGTGDDTISGGDGNDVIGGTAGNDRINGGAGADRVTGGYGDDVLAGSGGNDRIDAGPGNDTAAGEPGNDWIDGDDGDDRLDGGSGSDNLQGGTGINTCRLDAADTSTQSACVDLQAPVVHIPTARWIATTVDNAQARPLSLRVRVTDDRAGVAYGSVSVAAAGGTSVSLYNSRRVSGTANDGVWQFSGALPPGAALGEWHVQSISVHDRTWTHAHAWQPAGFPAFTVTGIADTEPPVLDPASASWVGGTEFENSAQRLLRLRMRITDDRAGIGGGSVELVNGTAPSRTLTIAAHPISGSSTDGVFEFSGVLPAHAAPGTWTARDVTVEDRVGRQVRAVPVVPALTVTGVADTEPPVLHLSTARWATPAVVDNGADRTLRLRMRVTDDRAGLSYGTVILKPVTEDGGSAWLAPLRLVSGTATDGVWEFSGTLPAHSRTGRWHVHFVEGGDGVHPRVWTYDPPETPTLTVVAPG